MKCNTEYPAAERSSGVCPWQRLRGRRSSLPITTTPVLRSTSVAMHAPPALLPKTVSTSQCSTRERRSARLTVQRAAAVPVLPALPIDRSVAARKDLEACEPAGMRTRASPTRPPIRRTSTTCPRSRSRLDRSPNYMSDATSLSAKAELLLDAMHRETQGRAAGRLIRVA